MSQALLSQEEKEILDILGNAWNKFRALPVLHEADHAEFRTVIHAAQNIILARPAMDSDARVEIEFPTQARCIARPPIPDGKGTLL